MENGYGGRREKKVERECCGRGEGGCGCAGDDRVDGAMYAGVERPEILDALVYDKKGDRILLLMYERRRWAEENEEQLWQLQEKFNAYASFVLDGELRELYPELVGKRVCIQLRTVHEPSAMALAFLEHARQQLLLMDVEMEVWVIGDEGE